MTDEEVWAMVMKKEKTLRKVCSKYAKGQELEDLYLDVVIGRALAIMRTYDPSKVGINGRSAQPFTHLYSNVKWYAFKWREKRKQQQRRESTAPNIADSGHDTRVSLDAELDLSHLLTHLPSQLHSDVLRWVELEGCTSREVASHLGITNEEASLIHAEAMLQLKHVSRGLRYSSYVQPSRTIPVIKGVETS